MPSAARQYAEHRKFTLAELAYFAVPRSWNTDLGIDRRFEKSCDDQGLRDAIIHVDDEPGGLGFLHWDQPAGTWELTKKGRLYVGALGGEKLLVAGAAWVPARARAKKPKYATRASLSSCNVKPKKADILAAQAKRALEEGLRADMDYAEGPVMFYEKPEGS